MSAESIRKLKADALIPKPKKIYYLNKVSKKNKKRIEDDGRPDDERLDEWFLERRPELVGTCQCGCGQPSCKKDDMYFRFSICHIFPKAHYKSVMVHPLNFVERAFWGGCHSNLDNRSVEKWVGMADWNDIQAKVIAMEPYLTPEEKGRKFCQKLLELVHSTE